MDNYDFFEQKRVLKDTNKLFNNWLDLVGEERQYRDINLGGRYNFFVNRGQRVAVYRKIGHHSSKQTNSRHNQGSRRTGAHNVARANIDLDPEGISTTVSNAFRAVEAFFSDPQNKGYRLAVTIRSDVHTCSVFIKRQEDNTWDLVLFNTLDARFEKFNVFLKCFGRRKNTTMYTIPNVGHQNLCDAYSFNEIREFFRSSDRPFQHPESKPYKSR